MGRKRTRTNFGLEPNVYTDRDRYRYRHPVTGKFFSLGADKIRANSAARKLNARLLGPKDLTVSVLSKSEGVSTFHQLAQEYIDDVIPDQPWSDGTKSIKISHIKRFQRSFGEYALPDISRNFIHNWLSENTPSNGAFNKNLIALSDVLAYAVSRGYLDTNEANMVRRKSSSNKLAGNRRKRKRLEIDEFKAIRKVSPDWLKIAMDMALITLQGRTEVCKMRWSDVRDGHLYVIRQKTSTDSDMAFIRIAITETVSAILRRARELPPESPFVIHRVPLRSAGKALDTKEHWTQVLPEYVSSIFPKYRDLSGLFDSCENPPTFHEIRSLGARLYKEKGYPKSYIRKLMTHSDEKVTGIYLAGQSLTEEHYLPVQADLDLDDLPAFSG